MRHPTLATVRFLYNANCIVINIEWRPQTEFSHDRRSSSSSSVGLVRSWTCAWSVNIYASLAVSTCFGRWSGPPTHRHQVSFADISETKVWRSMCSLAFNQLSVEQVLGDYPIFHTMGMSKTADTAMILDDRNQALESSSLINSKQLMASQ